MYEFIRSYQLDIMLLLCGACALSAFQLALTRFLSENRKRILIGVELIAFFLLWFDRLAYIYASNPSQMGFVMVRVSNFFVFFLTPGFVGIFNIYLSDWLTNEGEMTSLPKRLTFVKYVSLMGMLLAVISAFFDLYYYFDETNQYHRGQWFMLAYMIPILCPILQYTVIHQYKKRFSKLIFLSMVLYIYVPIACGIIQIFTYGISIVNMSMVLVSISLYFFNYLDINNTVERAHEIEIKHMQGEQARMKNLFAQTAMAFVSAVEKKDEFSKGNAVKVAKYARRIAQGSGKEADECDKIYYAALLHDVGLIGIPDSVIQLGSNPNKWDSKTMQEKLLIGNEILSRISEYPFLCETAHYSHERYNGTGYPEGLSGEEIPEMARIVAVADAYVTMTTKKSYREAKPIFLAREAIVKGSGEAFDPKYAEIMLRILDEDSSAKIQNEAEQLEAELSNRQYRETVSAGIPVVTDVTRVTFEYSPIEGENTFSAPSIVVFDSYDKRVHDNERAVEAFKYIEYAEIWFDGHSIQTAARKIEETVIHKTPEVELEYPAKYEIVMGRYADHLRLKMTSPWGQKEVIIALRDGAQAAFVALTGENCELKNITTEFTGETVGDGDIPRIADKISYTDRMESDVKNLQIDRSRSAATEGIEISDRLKLTFHSKSLPGADFIWHCPYIVIFSSDDGKVKGEHYREYGLVKLYGENEGDTAFSHNSISMKKTEEFPGWDVWKTKNKEGLEFEVRLKKKGSRIVLRTVNLGIETENITTIEGTSDKVFVAITGDRVAITDIRIKASTAGF